MTKVEIDGKTYCVETLIYTVERLTKDVKASAEYHRLVLDEIGTEIRKKMSFNSFNEGYVLYDDITEVLDKYKTERR